MRDITLKELLEAGCHFGHQSNRWHPKAKDYIYTERDGVHIIDLSKTRECLLKAGAYLSDLAKSGGNVIFVGTKRQAKSIVEEQARQVREKFGDGSGFYYLLERWPGGLLTNFDTIKKNNLDAIVRLQKDIADNNFVTKKEKLLAQRKLSNYQKIYAGLVGLTSLPEAVFIIDVKREAGTISEALRTGVKIVAITDTNVDPTPVDYQIPANDDAAGSIKIITETLVEAWVEGREEFEKVKKTVQAEEAKKKAEANKKSEAVDYKVEKAETV